MSRQRRLMKSKIHRAVITEANLEYEGSLTIDKDLMEAADIVPYEEVHLWNITRGTRLVTYAIEGPRGSGVICANGGAAHLNRVGDMVVIATFANVDESELEAHRPIIVHVDTDNHIVRTKNHENHSTVSQNTNKIN